MQIGAFFSPGIADNWSFRGNVPDRGYWYRQMDKHFVFVYGSLRRGNPGAMSLRFPDSQFIAEGAVSGALYDLGAYPGLLAGESDSLVTGEVYEVDDETLRDLDDFEASSNYRRKQVEVSVDTDKSTCWIYVPEYDAEFYSHRPHISSGDWMEYANSKNASPEDPSPDETQS